MAKNMISDNMSDSEIRILGGDIDINTPTHSNKPDPKKNILLWIMLVFLLGVIVLLCTHIYRHKTYEDTKVTDSLCFSPENLSIASIKESSSKGPVYTSEKDTIINDIPLRMLIPVGGRMDLYVGKYPEKEKGMVLAVHAADMRGDTYEPTGAFVYKGEIISKGHSKYGFCAIIDGEVTIGRQTETPLFERAIEQNGSFFRQYSLVSGGKMMIIPPKGKAIRRALCLTDDKMIIVETKQPESYLDLSQALVDLDVNEALALCGSNAGVLWRDKNGLLHKEGGVFPDKYQHENYIIWKK